MLAEVDDLDGFGVAATNTTLSTCCGDGRRPHRALRIPLAQTSHVRLRRRHRVTELTRAGRSHPAQALSAPLTSFIGRALERGKLSDMFKEHGQVTAVDPGGVGKTRFALAVAAEAAGEYSDGVWRRR
ncbi:hypothetical protein [Streptosporangium sp. NPDC003464]